MEPITTEWLQSIGFKCVQSDIGPTYTDHWQRGELNIWEFNDTGVWLWSGYDGIEMRTKDHLLQLIKWIEWR